MKLLKNIFLIAPCTFIVIMNMQSQQKPFDSSRESNLINSFNGLFPLLLNHSLFAYSAPGFYDNDYQPDIPAVSANKLFLWIVSNSDIENFDIFCSNLYICKLITQDSVNKALMVAAHNGSCKIVYNLFTNPILSPLITQDRANDFLMQAAHNEQYLIVWYALSEYNICKWLTQASINKILIWAAEKQFNQINIISVNQLCNFVTQDSANKALLIAAKNGFYEIAEFLLNDPIISDLITEYCANQALILFAMRRISILDNQTIRRLVTKYSLDQCTKLVLASPTMTIADFIQIK